MGTHRMGSSNSSTSKQTTNDLPLGTYSKVQAPSQPTIGGKQPSSEPMRITCNSYIGCMKEAAQYRSADGSLLFTSAPNPTNGACELLDPSGKVMTYGKWNGFWRGSTFYAASGEAFAVVKPRCAPWGTQYCSFTLEGSNKALYKGKGWQTCNGGCKGVVTNSDGEVVGAVTSSRDWKQWDFEIARNADAAAVVVVFATITANAGGSNGNPVGALAGAGVI